MYGVGIEVILVPANPSQRFYIPERPNFDWCALKVLVGETRVTGKSSLFSFFLTCCILRRESSRDLLTRGNFHSKLPDPERSGMHEEWPVQRRRRHRAGGKERYVAVSPLCFLSPFALFPFLLPSR